MPMILSYFVEALPGVVPWDHDLLAIGREFLDQMALTDAGVQLLVVDILANRASEELCAHLRKRMEGDNAYRGNSVANTHYKPV